MSTNNYTHKKAMIQALEKTLGIVTDACKEVGISRNAHYQWMREDEEYRNAVESIGDIAIDFAESKLHQKINGIQLSSDNGETVYTKEPSDTAIIFYLKTKGKKRGYIERQEIEHDASDKFILQLGVNRPS